MINQQKIEERVELLVKTTDWLTDQIDILLAELDSTNENNKAVIKELKAQIVKLHQKCCYELKIGDKLVDDIIDTPTED